MSSLLLPQIITMFSCFLCTSLVPSSLFYIMWPKLKSIKSFPSLLRTPFRSLPQCSRPWCLSSPHPWLAVTFQVIAFPHTQRPAPSSGASWCSCCLGFPSYLCLPGEHILVFQRLSTLTASLQPHTKWVNHFLLFFAFILNHMSMMARNHYYKYVFTTCVLIRLWIPWGQGVLSHLCNSRAWKRIWHEYVLNKHLLNRFNGLINVLYIRE